MFRIFSMVIASVVVGLMVLGAGVAPVRSVLATELREAESPGSAFFHVEWTRSMDRRGQSKITGYVYNDYQVAATNVELQISTMGVDGREVASATARVPGTIPALGRAYFEATVPHSSPDRVSVVAFDFVEGTSR